MSPLRGDRDRQGQRLIGDRGGGGGGEGRRGAVTAPEGMLGIEDRKRDGGRGGSGADRLGIENGWVGELVLRRSEQEESRAACAAEKVGLFCPYHRTLLSVKSGLIWCIYKDTALGLLPV